MIYDESDKPLEKEGEEKAENVDDLLNLRPRVLSEYVGQEKAVETLKIAIEAALKRGESLEHILLNGPPGLGKTTLAHIIANEIKHKNCDVFGTGARKRGRPHGAPDEHGKRGTSFLSTRYTGYRRSSKNFSTRPWRISQWTSYSTGASMPVRTGIGLSASP